MNCEWEPFQDKYKCKFCGFIVNNENIHKNCKELRKKRQNNKEKITPKIPNMSTRAKNFAKASIKHVMTGRKHCSDEQKAERLSICKSNQCGFFIPRGDDGGGVCGHKKCGCMLRSQGRFLDKISWADSGCPVGKWGPVQVKSDENT